MSDLRIEIVEDPQGLIVKLGGQFTILEESEFNQCVKLLTARKPALLVLDLSELTHLSSAGIGAFLRLRRTLTDLKCALRMAALPAPIAQVLQFSRLTEIFDIRPTVTEALDRASPDRMEGLNGQGAADANKN